MARPESAKGVVFVDSTTPIEDSGRATPSLIRNLNLYSRDAERSENHEDHEPT